MKTKDVQLFVFDGMSDWEAGYAIAGINNPQFQNGQNKYRVRTVAPDIQSVVTTGGIRIQPDLNINDCIVDNSAMLILPGGTSWDSGGNIEAVEKAREFLSHDVPVAAICGATGGLARGGLLETRRHTSNAREYLASTQYGGIDLYEEAPAVTDNNLITASGTMPVDFAYHIFKILEIYSQPVLDAWYGLFKTGQAQYFYELMNAMPQSGSTN